MVKLAMISHGEFCNGLLNTIAMVGGSDFGIEAVPLLPGVTPEVYRAELKIVFDRLTKDDPELLVLCDIAGGTPYQSALYLGRDYKMNVIAGMNLPLVLDLALASDSGGTLKSLVDHVQTVGEELLGVKIEQFQSVGRKRNGKLSISPHR